MPLRRPHFSFGLRVLVVGLAIYFPFFGVSLIAVGLFERFVLKRLVGTRRWLGLAEMSV
jgi:uncharacterized iron-regulated membrane protein